MKKLNSPKLLTGMKPIKFITPTEQEMGYAVKTNEKDGEWYDYGITSATRKWANAETEDGSMWVWIPRYAYKISESGSIDVKFLIGTTDYYYDDNGKMKKAQRATEETTGESYIVHPTFTDESEIDFANGGWDKELTGIWIAKFEAGYAGGNNDTKQVNSGVTYANATTNYYGSCTTDTKIKYPVFKPTTFSMNNISLQDAYKISKALTGANNIYGLNKNKTDADSHLIKNSEWGAVAYLSRSNHGKVSEVTINNANLNNSINTIYGITGCTSNSTNAGEIVTTTNGINNVTGNTATNGIYSWNQVNGQNASTTGNIYGIYDMNGGLWERTAAFIYNETSDMQTYGGVLKNEIGVTRKSSKYITIFADVYTSNNTIGDAIRETSVAGAGNTSGWEFADLSIYFDANNSFFMRGGQYTGNETTGVFSFNKSDGAVANNSGFRAVLIAE